MAKVFLGIPHTGWFNYQTVHSLLNLNSTNIKGYVLIGNCLVYEARKQIIDMALKNEYTHVFFMDSDMTIPSGTIEKLLAYDKDIVSLMAFKRQPPFDPCFYKGLDENGMILYHDYQKNGLVEVAGVGLACALIKTDVFKNTDQPWFFPMDGYGEDLAFCIRARGKGYKIFVDTGCSAGHLETIQVTEAHYEQYKENQTNEQNHRNDACSERIEKVA